MIRTAQCRFQIAQHGVRSNVTPNSLPQSLFYFEIASDLLRFRNKIGYSFRGFTGRHNRNPLNLSECKCKHVFLVTRHDQVDFAGDNCSQDRVVIRVWGYVYHRGVSKDKSVCINILNNGNRFIGVYKSLQSRSYKKISNLSNMRSGHYDFDLAILIMPDTGCRAEFPW